MKKSRSSVRMLNKVPTGITGLDEITGGGLPRGRATLLLAGPGCGKTVLALETLVNGARDQGEPGVFVAFEESANRIVANAATFGWDLPGLQRKQLFFLDAQVPVDEAPTGTFDLQALLAALDVKVRRMKARRIVFDSVDVLLHLLDNPRIARREMNRLHEWLLDRGLTAIITAKAGRTKEDYDYLPFMVDCVVGLKQEVVTGVAQRSLRVLKYRGSPFGENEFPLIIGPAGIEVAGGQTATLPARLSNQRISSGVPDLDAMMEGGYYRGSSVLITGSPGTAKTTFSGAFAAAACARGERTLFISFDSEPPEIIRNLNSVGIRLEPLVRRGLLCMRGKQSSMNNAEVHLLRIQALARTHRAQCLVIDPVSALSNQGNELKAHGVVERLVHWAKTAGMTVFCTSLLERSSPAEEGTDLQISTIADTWIHLSYLIQGGERNRVLTIVKSRGTAHSNQVRELLLGRKGVTLAEISTSSGQVLLGTQRWQAEQTEQAEQLRARREMQRQRLQLKVAQAELQDKLHALREEIKLKQTELDLLEQQEQDRTLGSNRKRVELLKRRGGSTRRQATPGAPGL